MQQFYKVDKDTGLFVEPVLFDDGIIPVDEDIVLVNIPEGFHLPKWDKVNEVWIEGKTATDILLNKKDAKIKELSASCTQAIFGRFASTVDGTQYEFSYDREAQSNFNGIANALSRGYITQVEWTAYDSNGVAVRIMLDAPKFDSVAIDALVHANAKISRFRNELIPQVMASTSETEISSILW